MRIVKRIIVWMLSIIILLLIISFFLKRKVYIERSVTVDVPAVVIFDEVNTLKNWEQWSPWNKKDPMMSINYEGPESGVKSKYSWESKNKTIGKGYVEIKEVKPNELIELEIKFPDLKPALTAFAFEKNDSGTKVTWSVNVDMGRNNPFGKYMSLFVKKRVGVDFQNGLNNLKEVVEKMPKVAKDTMKVVNTPVTK